MLKLPKIVFTGLITSLFLFPLEIPPLHMNSKMLLALIGLVCLIIDKIGDKNPSISVDFIGITIISFGVSAMAQLSVAFNHTSEDSFTDYFMSFFTWMGAAYVVVRLIEAVHHEVTVKNLGNYLIGVCVFQCLTAYIVDVSTPVKEFIDSIVVYTFSLDSGRLYGLGAFLDPSGLRFAAILIILTALFLETGLNTLAQLLYSLSFLIIGILGCMISRSTSIGIALSLVYAICFYIQRIHSRELKISPLFGNALILLGGILLTVYLYNHDITFHRHLRFGFEGFFNYFEYNRFETRSTNILKNMIVLPESLKTWIIGDGYLANPRTDPNYLGPVSGGYYMSTDIGYLRFIFFFGVLGMLFMLAMFIKATTTCMKAIPHYSLLFVFLLVSNLIFWIKVSSDILMVFAPFLILAYKQSRQY